MKAFSSDRVLSKWKDFISHLVSRYGAVRIEEDEMFMVEFWFQENRKVPRGFSDGDFVKNVYVSLDDFMGEKYVGFSSVVGNIIPENLDKALEYLESWPWGKVVRLQKTRVGTLHADHARIAAQSVVEQIIANIHRIDARRACAQHHVGKSARRSTHVDTVLLLQRNLKDVERALELVRTTTDISIQFTFDPELLVRSDHLTGAQNLAVARHHSPLHNQRSGELNGFQTQLFQKRGIRAAFFHEL